MSTRTEEEEETVFKLTARRARSDGGARPRDEAQKAEPPARSV